MAVVGAVVVVLLESVQHARVTRVHGPQSAGCTGVRLPGARVPCVGVGACCTCGGHHCTHWLPMVPAPPPSMLLLGPGPTAIGCQAGPCAAGPCAIAHVPLGLCVASSQCYHLDPLH